MMTNYLKIIYISFNLIFITNSSLAADKHALLIAIQDYQKTSFNSLKGAVNDIKLTENMLRARFGFVDEDFMIIINATHTGIENAFNTLIEHVNHNDFVYIHYSGHGSQTADLNGDERSGNDQTWVSYGARTTQIAHKDNYDVLDDEIGGWLAALYAKTHRVIFVSDSCHSATVSRAVERGEALVRGVKQDERAHLLGKLAYKQPTLDHGIRVGAAREEESAIEFMGEDGQYYGLFTWYWIQNLQQAQASDSWGDIFKRTYAQVTGERGIAQQPYMPQPQLEGQSDQLVLRDGFSPLPPRFPVYPINEDKVKMLIGSLAGVTKGSIYRLYKDATPRLTIFHVNPFHSYGKPNGAFKMGDLVVEEHHVYQKITPFKMYLDQPLLQKIRNAFDGHTFFTFTDDPKKSNLRLHLSKSELWILTAEQRLIYNNLKIPFDNPKQGIELLQDNLNKLARLRELKKLKSRSRLPIGIQTHTLTPIKTCQKGMDCVWLSDYGLGLHNKTLLKKNTLPKGVFLTFTLHNFSKRDYYSYLLNLSPDGAIYDIFPPENERTEFARIKKGEKRKLEVLLPMTLIGKETIKVITSSQPIDLSLLTQSHFNSLSEQAPSRRDNCLKGNFNPLERLLAMSECRRNLLQIDEWSTDEFIFEVVP